MSSDSDERASRPSEDPAASSGHTPGALLKQERLRRGLSVQQAAEGLHLDPWIVEAIEANQFLPLGAPVYAKGYLRKYAVLLDLAPEVIVTRYEALSDTPEVPTPVPVITTTPPPRPKWPKRLAWSLLVVLLVVIGWFAFDVLMPPPASTPSLQPQPTATMNGQTASLVADSPTSTATVSPAVMTTEAPVAIASTHSDVVQSAATTPASEPPRVAKPSTSESSTRLRLEFSEASWVEVYDANGQRLLYDVGLPDRARDVAGQAPLSVVIGLASAVTAHVNDRQIVVPRRASKDSTRFNVGADGSVQ